MPVGKGPPTNTAKTGLFCSETVNFPHYFTESFQGWGNLDGDFIKFGYLRGEFTGIIYVIWGRFVGAFGGAFLLLLQKEAKEFWNRSVVA